MLLLLFFVASLLPCRAEGAEIFWGKEAVPHSRPYMALLQYCKGEICYFKCGGFLVKEDFVMTAAHCKESNMSVILGVHNRMIVESSWQTIPVLRAHHHEQYDNEIFINDIMLLKLKRKAQINKYVKTIPLPHTQRQVKPGRVCTVAGWGNLANGNLPDKLQEVDLQVQDKKMCQKLFKNNYNDSIELCVGNPDYRKATGSGDSGGPFVCDGVAEGIVSSAHVCAQILPRVFTRISSFLDWIHKAMKSSRS